MPASPPLLRGGLFSVVAATPQEFRGIFSEFQDVANQSGVMPHHYRRAAGYYPFSPVGSGQANGGQVGFCKAGGLGHHPSFFK